MEATTKKALLTEVPEKTELDRIRTKLTEPEVPTLHKESIEWKVENKWTEFGPLEPLMTALFTGVKFPVNTVKELIMKAGGPERLLRVETPKGIIVYSLLDVVEAWPQIETFFPMRSPAAIATSLEKIELEFRREHKLTPFMKIPTTHLKRIVTTKNVYRNYVPQMYTPDSFLFMPEVFFKPEFYFKPELVKNSGFEVSSDLMEEGNKETMEKFFDPEMREVKAMLPTITPKETVLLKELISPANLEVLKKMPENTARIFEQYLHTVVNRVTVEHETLAQEYFTKAEKKVRTANEHLTEARKELTLLVEAPTYELSNEYLHKLLVPIHNLFRATKYAEMFAFASFTHARAVPGEPKTKSITEKLDLLIPEYKRVEYLGLELLKKAKEIASIPIITFCGTVVEIDPVFNRNLENVKVTAQYLGVPEIPEQTVYTNKEGWFTIEGRFGYSPLLGPARLLITCTVNTTVITREFTITNDAPTPFEIEYVPMIEW